MACIQAVALYGSKLWWDPRKGGRRDDLQLLLNRQGRSILGALPTAPRGALMTEAALTPAPVILDSGQQRFTARLANACSNKLQELHKNPASSAPICRVVKKEHEHGRTTKALNCPAPGEEPAVRTTMLDDTTAGQSTTQRWARENESYIGAGLSMCWNDGSRSDDGRVAAVAVCKHENQWRSRRCSPGTGRMEGFKAELWAIGLALDVAIEKGEALQIHGVRTVAVFSNSQVAI